MTRRRLIIAHIAIAVLVGAHLFAVATGIELWPFSPYPMYSELNRDRTMTILRLVGVTESGSEVPIDAAWLRKSFNSMRGDRAKIERGIAAYSHAYKDKRPPGVEPGPPFLGYRLYEHFWLLRTDGGNIEQPDRVELLAAVER